MQLEICRSFSIVRHYLHLAPMIKLIKDRWIGFINALHGMKIYFLTENSAWWIWLTTPAALFACWYFGVSKAEWLAIILSIGLVASTEILNTSIEEVLDHLHPERHASVGKAKDLAAGAVLFASFTAIAVGCVVFGPRLLELFTQ